MRCLRRKIEHPIPIHPLLHTPLPKHRPCMLFIGATDQYLERSSIPMGRQEVSSHHASPLSAGEILGGCYLAVQRKVGGLPALRLPV